MSFANFAKAKKDVLTVELTAKWLGLIGSALLIQPASTTLYSAVRELIETPAGNLGTFMKLEIGLALLVAGGAGIVGTFLSTSFPLIGGVVQITIGAGGVIICLLAFGGNGMREENMILMGFSLLLVSGFVSLISRPKLTSKQ